MTVPDYQAQHKKRLSYMPWLYFSLKPKLLSWAQPWQKQVQAEFMALETVTFGDNCFIAPEVKLFAEPGRDIAIGSHCMIAADSFLHGPISLGDEVAINHGCSLDGGRNGIKIGKQTRIANNVTIYAFNHGMAPDTPIYQQASNSKGVTIGKDVWIGAQAGIVDGVSIGDHAVIGMGCIVTKDVADFAIVAGNPAKVIGDRRDKR
ncbi:transferase hexapeptide repeat containing protein [Shewanella woodyi ATCC 51908]|uniref:Transferase hexapeptide repeat containing protein n=2 Tax=Shewanella woodyi TaxID=60961 RepID=B1KNQ4_SHEWM|nr:transferase hexapeptide repeat containing protein [Shewanella woodyi ATCC 51908]